MVDTRQDSQRGETEERTARSGAQRALPHRRFFPADSVRASSWYAKFDEGRPATAHIDRRAFLASWSYLAILVSLIHVYKIEGRAFEIMMWTVLATLPVYELAPFRLRKPILAASAVIALSMIYGLAAAAAVLGFGAAMVALARNSRLSWNARAGAIATIALGLAVGRSTGVLNFMPPAFWAVAGTMLMFRLALYMYELKHARKPETLVDTASYFLILPNWCFLHFPVVDYRTLQRGFYAKDIQETRRRGLNMVFAGVMHLLCYRLVYHELLITPADVVNPGTLAAYLACNYLLYLRVSGQFHIACGVLHLFGHHMPETHNKYLLASSFTDYWRRINIYWKDFMVKTVFNPVFFRMRKRPQPVALGVATVAVFVATWALHAWQSFWLRGTWGLSVTDGMFWGILGVMVLINVQWDARRKPTPRKTTGPSTGERIRGIAGVGGMILSITLLWSLWSAQSLGDWIAMMGRGFTIG